MTGSNLPSITTDSTTPDAGKISTQTWFEITNDIYTQAAWSSLNSLFTFITDITGITPTTRTMVTTTLKTVTPSTATTAGKYISNIMK